jgi:uncharacterized protein YkwD
MRKVATLAISLLAVLLVACSPEETSHALAVNAFRQANGVPALGWDDTLYAKAHAWSQQMADAGKISHSTLRDGAPADWRILGENVAVNSSLEGAMTALENSPSHRANLLDRRFTRGAVGVVFAKGVYWVTEEFVG